MTYFSSDWHLSHKNIIKYDGRPFNTIEEMDHEIIGNATRQLKKGDIFYFLGDFCLTRSSNTIEGFLKALTYTEANLFFIKGNHDHTDSIVKLYKKYGEYLGEQKKIKVEDQEIILNHYSMRVWDKSHHGSWHLYGHSHDGLEKEPWGKSMDCGVHTAYRIKGKYELFEYQEIKKILDKREVKIIDHHGKSRE